MMSRYASSQIRPYFVYFFFFRIANEKVKILIAKILKIIRIVKKRKFA